MLINFHSQHDYLVTQHYIIELSQNLFSSTLLDIRVYFLVTVYSTVVHVLYKIFCGAYFYDFLRVNSLSTLWDKELISFLKFSQQIQYWIMEGLESTGRVKQ